MKRVGFMFEETMSGSYTRSGRPGEGGSLRLQLRARTDDVRRYLRDHLVTVEGTLEMEGFAHDAPVRGTIEIAPIRKRLIRYELDFTANDGRPHRFVGQKDIRLTDLLATWTTCHGAIFDERGDEVARGTIRFDLSDLVPFLASWRPALAD